MDKDIDLSMPIATAEPVGGGGPVLPIQATAVHDDDKTSGAFSSLLLVDQDDALQPHQQQRLRSQGFPSGLALELARTRRLHPIRYWILDNSGSMRSADGHRQSGTSNGLIPCTRWAELQDTIVFHSELAGTMELPSVFRFLNAPTLNSVGGSGRMLVVPQEFRICCSQTENDAARVTIPQQVQAAQEYMQATAPAGVTPLVAHVQHFATYVRALQTALRAQGQQAVLILCTDGLPTNDHGNTTSDVQQVFIDALLSLQSLPAWIVVRLCTDDDAVVQFYNNLDADLELPLEVLDDWCAEGAEIATCNPWLNYAAPLHRCRELGYHPRLVDLLDERALTADEVLEFCELLFADLVDIATRVRHNDNATWSDFMARLQQAVHAQGKEYNPITKRLEWWIDVKMLNKAYNPNQKRGFGLLRRNKR